ncbi:MAG TPA: glycosyltransferase family 4 protein [Galbitalea sp.]
MSEHAGMPVYFVVPDSIDDPERVSGGNLYDRRVRDGLRERGWAVQMLPISDAGETPVARTISELPDGALTLIDGLLAVRESDALAAHSNRLRIVVLAHMVASATMETTNGSRGSIVDRERESLRAAKRIIATSSWTRAELISRDLAEPDNVVVATPGTEPAAKTVASRTGGRLLCVGVVAPHKGQDLLVRALRQLTEIDGWTCTFAGSVNAAPGFARELAQTIRVSKLATRTTFTGVLDRSRLDDAYNQADLVVVPSRNESFGMVVAEALARGIPVLATRVGGIPEAICGSPASILVPPEDPWALEVVLRQWLADPERRTELRTAAAEAREMVRPWAATVTVIASTLAEVALSATAVSA